MAAADGVAEWPRGHAAERRLLENPLGLVVVAEHFRVGSNAGKRREVALDGDQADLPARRLIGPQVLDVGPNACGARTCADHPGQRVSSA